MSIQKRQHVETDRRHQFALPCPGRIPSRRLRIPRVLPLVVLCLLTSACDQGHQNVIRIQLDGPASRLSATMQSASSRAQMISAVEGVCTRFGLTPRTLERLQDEQGVIRYWWKQVHRSKESRMHDTFLDVTIRTIGDDRYEVVVSEFVTPVATPESFRLYEEVNFALSRVPGLRAVDASGRKPPVR